MKLQSITTLLSIALSLSTTTAVDTESVKNIRGDRKLAGPGSGEGSGCTVADYEGVWAYISQGTGASYNTIVRVE